MDYFSSQYHSPVDQAFIDRSGIAFLIAGLSFLTLGVITMNAFFKCDYIQIRDHSQWSVVGGYTVSQFVALVIATYMLPVGIIFMLIYAVQSYKNDWGGYWGKIIINFLLFLVFLAASVASYFQSADVLECGIFCMTGPSTQSDINNAAIVSFGLLYFIFSFGFTVLFLFMTIYAGLSYSDPEPPLATVQTVEEVKPLIPAATTSVVSKFALSFRGNKDSTPPPSASATAVAQSLQTSPSKNYSHLRGGSGSSITSTGTPSPSHTRLISISSVCLVFAVLYPLLFFACTALPTWWADFTKYSIQKNLADQPSQEYGTYWSISLGDGIILKLFPDILIYYASIYAVACIALLSEAFPALRTRLHSRPTFLLSFTVGEALLLITLIFLSVGLFIYWYFDHAWEQRAYSSRSAEERAARSIGQVANMVTGLLVLPVTRNSVWHVVIGVSWESMIKYHRYLGYLLGSLVMAHMGLWWKVYAQQDTFPHDIFAVPQEYHSDNFTIPLAVLTVFLSIILIFTLSLPIIRRANYDLFYWSHHFSLCVFLLMLWHSTMSWYYITGSLALWAIDHVLRLTTLMSTKVSIQSMTIVGNGDVVKLSYLVSQQQSPWSANEDGTSRGGKTKFKPLTHSMGQYCFVNIPLISQLAWHPFTISGPPGEAVTSHHIRVMGNDQWTGRLHLLAKSLLSSPPSTLSNIVMNIDGPYGIPLQASRYRNILLVAGGIGITPMHSCFKHMFLCHMGLDKWSYAHVKRIRLVWVVRNQGDASIFEDSLREIVDLRSLPGLDGGSGGSGGGGGGGGSSGVKGGRGGPSFSASIYITGTKGKNNPVSYGSSGSSPQNTTTNSKSASSSNSYNDSNISKLKHQQGLNGSSGGYAGIEGGGAGAGVGDFKMKYGRPDLLSEIMALSPWGMGSLVYVCGPSSMVETCSAHALRSKVDFRAETFEL